MTKKFWLAALAATLGFASLAMAQPAHHGRHGGTGNGPDAANFEALKTYFGLTDTQIAGLRQARSDAFEQAKPGMKASAQKARDLRVEMNKSNPDPNTVGRLMTEMKESRAQNSASPSQIRDKSMAILTEAQKNKLKLLEEAASLQDAVREARMSGLLNAPADSGGSPMMRGAHGFRQQH